MKSLATQFRKRAIISALALGFGMGGVAWGQVGKPTLADLQEEVTLSKQALDLMLEGKSMEAAELYRQRIQSKGTTPTRQQQLCNFYSLAGEMGLLSDCVAAMKASLVNGRIPQRSWEMTPALTAQMETEQTYFHVMRAYQALGNFKAIAEFGQTGAKEAKASMRYLIIQMIGDAYVKLGDLDGARRVLRQIEEWQPDSPAERADYRASMPAALTGSVYDQMEEMHLNSAKGVRLVALQQMNIYLGNHEAALNYFDQKMAHDRATQSRAHANADARNVSTFARLDASMAITRAALLTALNRFTEAKAELDKADALLPTVTDRMWQGELVRAKVAEALGDLTKALKHYRKAVELIEAQRATLPGETARIGFAADKQEVYSRLVGLLIRTGAAPEAFEFSERAKSRALVDLLASRGVFAAKDGKATPQDTAQLLTELRRAENALNAQANASPEQQLKTRAVAMEAGNRLRTAAPELASLVTVTYVPVSEVQGLLKPEETLVEFFGYKDRFYAFVVNKQRVRSVVLSASAVEQVAAYRKALQDPQSKDVQGLGRALHAALIDPLGLPAGGSLIVVPHGGLHYLPFAALTNGKDTLIDRYNLRILPSASMIPLLAKRAAPPNKNTLVLGNPDLKDKQYDLPGAQKEAEEIAKLRPGTKVLLRGDATREAVTSVGGQYAYLHFASHGTFDARTPRSSGLLLATPPNASHPTDGMLTVDELYGLSLNADLVTMSACETALADVQSGDDVVGLNRGFFYAGANNIVSSLWQVDDAATEMMMVQFYKLLPTMPKVEALRKAQLAVKAKYPHPFYWAAFQLAGVDAQKAAGKGK